MTVPNGLETSTNTTGFGAKLAVEEGKTIIATGRHGLTSSLFKNYDYNLSFAWAATSFTGPGEWIQSGTLAGAGGFVVEPGAKLTLANNVNTFTGFVSASNSVLTIAANGGDSSFGAVPGSYSAPLQFTQGAILASSASLSVSSNRGIGITGSMGFDVLAGKTFTAASVIAGAGGFTKIGSGALVLSGANTFSGTATISIGNIDAANSQAFVSGAVAVQSGGTLRFSNASSATVGQIGQSLVLSGTTITIG